MFDNAQSLYNQYLAGKGSKLTVGIDIRDQSLPFMFEIYGDFDASTNATGKSAGYYLPSKQYVLPINPENYRMHIPTRAKVTMTQAGAFQDNIGLGLPRFSIQGTFGYLGTLVPGHAHSLDGKKKDAWQLFIDLEATFLDFYRRFGTYDERGKLVTKPVDLNNPPELRFYNFTDREFWSVQIDHFGLLRNTQRRFLYQYDIQMTGLKRVNASMEEDALLAALQSVEELPTDDLNLWDTILSGYTKTCQAMTAVVNGIEGIKQDFANLATAVSSFRNGISAVIEAPFSLVTSVTESIDSIIDSATSISDVPQEFTYYLRETKRKLLLLNLHQDKFHEPSSSTGTVALEGTASTATEIATTTVPRFLAEQGIVTSMDIPETTMFDDTLETTQSVPASVESILDSDTIETIAYRTLGDARAWRKIAMLNGLEYPYIANGMDRFTPSLGSGTMDPAASGDITIRIPDMTPSAGDVLVIAENEPVTVDEYDSEYETIYLTEPLANDYPDGADVTRHERKLSVMIPGDKIKIPGTVDNSSPISSGDEEDFAVKLYGIDEYLDDDGLQSTVTGDTETISGVDNLVMQLRHRLMTTRGELAALGHPEYGSYLPLIVGKVGMPIWHERAKLEAEITILQDPRIDRVDNLKLVAQDTALYIDADVYLIGQSNSETINIPLG